MVFKYQGKRSMNITVRWLATHPCKENKKQNGFFWDLNPGRMVSQVDSDQLHHLDMHLTENLVIFP
jgi:hypothetical protein